MQARFTTWMAPGLLALAMWLGAAACGGTRPPEADALPAASAARGPENKPSAVRLCTAFCDRSFACGLGPGEDCVRRCAARHRDNPHIRADFAWRLLTCLDAIDCPFVADGQAFRQCHEAMTRQLDITKALRHFCFQSARKAAQCGRRDDADQGECLDRYRYLEDSALQAGAACLAKPCAEVPACFGASFGMSR